MRFHQADAYSTGLPRHSFDMVYSRFLMCHLTNPAKALKEMRELLKKGGVLVCEDYEQDSVMTDPPTRAYARLCEISRALDAKYGLDSNIGLKLHRLFREAGFERPEVSLRQTVYLRGDEKRLWELTLREAAPVVVGAGIATEDELASLCSEMAYIARDETVLLVLARVSQVWAMKSN